MSRLLYLVFPCFLSGVKEDNQAAREVCCGNIAASSQSYEQELRKLPRLEGRKDNAVPQAAYGAAFGNFIVSRSCRSTRPRPTRGSSPNRQSVFGRTFCIRSRLASLLSLLRLRSCRHPLGWGTAYLRADDGLAMEAGHANRLICGHSRCLCFATEQRHNSDDKAEMDIQRGNRQQSGYVFSRFKCFVDRPVPYCCEPCPG